MWLVVLLNIRVLGRSLQSSLALPVPLRLSPPQEKAQGRNAHYKLTSTVMLWLQTIKADSGTMNLGGSLTRQAESDHAVSDSSPHIANIGRMVEVRLWAAAGYITTHLTASPPVSQDMENKMRQTLNEIYFGKTKDVVNDIR